MSIHMHDLQVQNKITSKNIIEAKKILISEAASSTTEPIKILAKVQGLATNDEGKNPCLRIEGGIIASETISANRLKSNGPITGVNIYGDRFITGDTNQETRLQIGYTIQNESKYGYILAGHLDEETDKDGNTLSPQLFGLCIEGKELSLINDEDEECKLTWSEGILNVPDLAIGDKTSSLKNQTISIAGENIPILGGFITADNLASKLSKSQNLKVSALNVVSQIGSISQPIYIDENGVPQQCTDIQATIAAASKFLDSEGNNLNTNINIPVYFENGVPQECSEILLNGENTKTILKNNSISWEKELILDDSNRKKMTWWIYPPPSLDPIGTSNPITKRLIMPFGIINNMGDTETLLSSGEICGIKGKIYGTADPTTVTWEDSYGVPVKEGQIYFKIISE